MPSLDVEKLAEAVRRAAAGKPVAAVYLHGSHARGEATPLSDVDIAIVVNRPMDPHAQFDLGLEFAAAVNTALGTDATEALVINEAPLLFQGEVLTHGKLLYCADDDCRVTFETRVRSEYFDFLPAYEKMAAAFLEHVAKEGL